MISVAENMFKQDHPNKSCSWLQATQIAKMRCIAVPTTHKQETLESVGPSLIRFQKGSVLLEDISSGGYGSYSM
ncbi:hypothetical protein LINPERPRIM_LOCUS20823 [Linum perenne]